MIVFRSSTKIQIIVQLLLAIALKYQYYKEEWYIPS